MWVCIATYSDRLAVARSFIRQQQWQCSSGKLMYISFILGTQSLYLVVLRFAYGVRYAVSVLVTQHCFRWKYARAKYAFLNNLFHNKFLWVLSSTQQQGQFKDKSTWSRFFSLQWNLASPKLLTQIIWKWCHIEKNWSDQLAENFAAKTLIDLRGQLTLLGIARFSVPAMAKHLHQCDVP